jgi:hypothetical protein
LARSHHAALGRRRAPVSRRTLNTQSLQAVTRRFATPDQGLARAVLNSAASMATWLKVNSNASQPNFFRRTEMLIKDLEMTKELSGKDLVAVRGGANFAVIGGPVQQANLTQASAGFSLVGPLAVSAPTQAFVPTVNQTDTDVDINSASLTNVLGQMNTALFQI